MKAIASFAFIFLLVFYSQSFSQTGLPTDSPSDKKIFINAGIAGPIFDLQEVYEYGPSVEAGIVIFSPPVTPFDISLSVGYNSFKYKSEFFMNNVQTQSGVAVTNFKPDWKVTDIPVMAGMKLRISRLNIVPFVSFELGAHFMNYQERFNGNQINVSATAPATVSLTNVSESASETAFGAAIGMGVDVSVARRVSLTFGVKYNYVGSTFTKLYKVVVSNGVQYSSKQLDRFEYLTGRFGVAINL